MDHGSFTGIRIGISLIKGMAEALNIPVITCTSLEALSLNEQGKRICALIDARNNQVYAGLFDSNHNLIGNYMADDIDKVLEKISSYKDIVFVGSGAVLHKDKGLNVSMDHEIHAKNVGILAFLKYKNGIRTSADEALPLYLRPSQAERMKNKNE